MWWNTKYIFIFFERHKWKKSLQRWTLTLEGHIGGVGEWTWCSISHFLKWSEVLTILFSKFWQSLWFQTNILLFYHSFYDTPHELQICMLFSSGSWVLDPPVCLQFCTSSEALSWRMGFGGEYHKEWAYCLRDREHGYSWIGIIKWMSVCVPPASDSHLQ